MAGQHIDERPLIIQYWHEDQPPDFLGEHLTTFRNCNPDMRHRVFSKRSAAELISEHFGPRELAAFNACAVPAMQADYFRYCALLALGGIYSDVDTRCIGSLRPLLQTEGSLVYHERVPSWLGGLGVVINNHPVAFRSPGHHLARLAIDVATLNIENRVVESVWGATGPGIFSLLYLLHRSGSIKGLLDRTPNDVGKFARTGKTMWDARSVSAAVTDRAHLKQAFQGVCFWQWEELRTMFAPAPGLPYKGTEMHWTKHRSSIYR